MAKICFETILFRINSWLILRFPKPSSEELPSRGMVMIKGTINDIYFEAPLEPDGMGSHWFRVNDSLAKLAKADVGDAVSLKVEPLKSWLEPELPLDLKEALDASLVIDQWNKITTKARWEWIRWIRFTNNAETRKKRIDVACSMLQAGKKRPCCFDQSRCTETSVSKSGVLMVDTPLP